MYTAHYIVVYMDERTSCDGLQCSVCGRVLPSKKSRAAHERYHNPKYAKNLSPQYAETACDICGKKFSSKRGASMHRVFHDDEYRKSISAKSSANARRRYNANPSGFYAQMHSPEARKRKSESLKAAFANGSYTADVRSARMKRAYKDQKSIEWNARRIRNIKAKANTDEQRRKHSEVSKRLNADPEYHRRISESLLRYWANDDNAESNMNHECRTPFSRKTIEHTRFGEILCESNAERRLLRHLCEDGNVMSVSRCKRIPYLWMSKTHSYYPDFDVVLSSGEHLIIEVKFRTKMKNPKVIAKARYAEWWCFTHGMRFMFVTDLQIKHLDNGKDSLMDVLNQTKND